MKLELNEEESRFLETVLTRYLSDLREEIVKTEKHQWIEALHGEEALLNAILGKLKT